MMIADKEMDARGLNCPLPILRCKKGLADLTAGQVLKVLATDAGAVKDFQAFCKQTGHVILSLEVLNPETAQGENAQIGRTEYIFHIQKRAD